MVVFVSDGPLGLKLHLVTHLYAHLLSLGSIQCSLYALTVVTYLISTNYPEEVCCNKTEKQFLPVTFI